MMADGKIENELLPKSSIKNSDEEIKEICDACDWRETCDIAGNPIALLHCNHLVYDLKKVHER